MRPVIKKPLFILLTACYSFVAAAGNLVLLRELLNSGDSHQQLTEQQQSRSLPGSPVWSIKSPLNQIHNADQSVHITPAETIVNPDRMPRTYHLPHFQSKYTFLESLPSKPRDPPIA